MDDPLTGVAKSSWSYVLMMSEQVSLRAQAPADAEADLSH